MIEQELKVIWSTSAQVEQIKFDTSRLLLNLKNKMSKMDRSLKFRDTLEIVIALFIIPLFGMMAYFIPFLLSKLGCLLIMAWAVYVIYKLRKTKKHKRPVDLSESLREQLEKYKIYIQKQAELIDSALYWYLLPPFVGITIMVVGVDVSALPLDFPDDPAKIFTLEKFILAMKAGYLLFVILLYGMILWVNKRGVKKVFIPIIKDIEKAQKQLDD